MDIERIVCEELSELTGLSVEELADLREENLFESGILDSLSLMTLITALKSRLGLDISLKKYSVKEFATIASITDILTSAE